MQIAQAFQSMAEFRSLRGVMPFIEDFMNHEDKKGGLIELI